MVSHERAPRRPGAQAVEAALVFPVVLFLLLGLIVGGMGVFRYQQVACLAQEGARYACVHGGDFADDANQDPPTQDQILQQALLPLAVGMDTSNLSLQVQWIDQGTNTVYDWDASPKDVKSITPQGEYVTNTVRVTVTYQWSPGLFIGATTLQSVCELPMSY